MGLRGWHRRVGPGRQENEGPVGLTPPTPPRPTLLNPGSGRDQLPTLLGVASVSRGNRPGNTFRRPDPKDPQKCKLLINVTDPPEFLGLGRGLKVRQVSTRGPRRGVEGRVRERRTIFGLFLAPSPPPHPSPVPLDSTPTTGVPGLQR